MVTSGVARIWCQGARRWRRRRCEHRGAKCPEWGGYVEGYPLPSQLGCLGSVVSCSRGVRDGAPAAIAFSAYFRRLGHRTLLVARKIRFSCPKYKEKLVTKSQSSHTKLCLWYMLLISLYTLSQKISNTCCNSSVCRRIIILFGRDV